MPRAHPPATVSSLPRSLARGALAALLILLGNALGACSREPAAESAPRPEHRLLVVGWDGATWEMIDPLLAAGRLPNLARLIASGSTARLASTVVPISSAAWVGAATGRDPAHSGVYGFFEPVPGTYDVQLISSRSNKATPIWRTLGRRGLRSVVFGVPVTYPPEPIAGTLVAGMLSPKDSVYTSPPALAERLRRDGFVPDLGIWRDAQSLSGEVIQKDLAVKRKALQEILKGEDWSLAFVVFKELDVLCHFAYDGRVDGPVASLYALLDAELGALLETVGPGTRVLLVSDHGFHAYPQSFFAQRWLLEQGFAVARAGEPPAEDLSSLPLAQRRAMENSLQMRALDLKRTRAYAGLAEGNFGSVRLNLAGREPQGSLSTADAEACLAAIESGLRALKVPGTQRPLVVRTWRRGELYHGPYEDLLGDLTFELDAEVAARPVDHVHAFESHDPPYPDHKREGVLVAAGPDVVGVSERGDASIFDVGPTALWLLGQAVYEDCEGRVLDDLFRGVPPVRRVPEAGERRRAEEERWLSDTSWSDADVEEVSKRLGNLGYVEAR